MMDIWPDRGRKTSYWFNILIGVDQSIGTLFGIDADETISSYLGRVHPNSKRAKFVDWLFYIATGERNHCINTIEPR